MRSRVSESATTNSVWPSIGGKILTLQMKLARMSFNSQFPNITKTGSGRESNVMGLPCEKMSVSCSDSFGTNRFSRCHRGKRGLSRSKSLPCELSLYFCASICK